MRVHLVDGTYELFRHFFAVPSHADATGIEVAAVRGVVGSMLMMLERRRDARRRGHRPRDRVVPQRPVARLQDRRRHRAGAAGAVPPARGRPRRRSAWPCGRWSSSRPTTRWRRRRPSPARRPAGRARADLHAGQGPGQCVRATRVVQVDRRARTRLIDEAGVVAKFGVAPASIPDYLALVGDSADGFPGLPGWGAKSAAAVLARYGPPRRDPRRPASWEVTVRGAPRLARVLTAQRDRAGPPLQGPGDAPDLRGRRRVDRGLGVARADPRARHALQAFLRSAPLAERAREIAARRDLRPRGDAASGEAFSVRAPPST